MKLDRKARLVTATVLWLGVGLMLAVRAYPYIEKIATTNGKLIALGAALIIGGLKGWFVLSRSAARTAGYISRRPERDWIWLSLHPILYLMIPLMVGLGLWLKHAYGETHPGLIVGVYYGIALALIVGTRGFRLRS